MTKLYTVHVEHEYVIAVEDDEDPYNVAEDTFRDVKYDMDIFSVDMFVHEMKSIPSGWDAKCYPYRIGAQERTIENIMEANKL